MTGTREGQADLRLVGRTGAKILSKIASLFLAAIAVMMVRKGVMLFLK